MRKWRPSHSGITVSPGMEEMPSLNMLVQRLKVAILPLDLPCSGPVKVAILPLDLPCSGPVKVAILPLDLPCSGPITHSGEILTTGKSHRKKPDRFSILTFNYLLYMWQWIMNVRTFMLLYWSDNHWRYNINKYNVKTKCRNYLSSNTLSHCRKLELWEKSFMVFQRYYAF